MNDVIADQQAALLQLYRAHAEPDAPYALLDFPDHANVGDSAIWLGEMTMLRQVTGRDPCFTATWHDFDAEAFRSACPAGTIFLHGGGNLGDIWPHHQRFREHIIATFPDRRIVQLPQSIHFDDPGSAHRFADLADRHPDLTLYARDERSLATAAAWLGERARLAPDSAFALGPQPRGAASIALLALMRSDSERHGDAAALPAGATIVDWLDEDTPPAGGTSIADRQRQARARVERGLTLLSRGHAIVTDRLHGHILALLLGIPHSVFDNRYGKVGAYIDAWTRGSPLLGAAAAA